MSESIVFAGTLVGALIGTGVGIGLAVNNSEVKAGWQKADHYAACSSFMAHSPSRTVRMGEATTQILESCGINAVKLIHPEQENIPTSISLPDGLDGSIEYVNAQGETLDQPLIHLPSEQNAKKVADDIRSKTNIEALKIGGASIGIGAVALGLVTAGALVMANS